MTITRGIDVSAFQGQIDWGRVGYPFALARMTIGRSTLDDHGQANLRGALAHVPLAGAYGVVGYTDPVEDGAALLVAQIAKVADPGRVLVMLDAENFQDGRHPTIGQVDAYAVELHRLLGRWPVAYVPGWWLTEHGYKVSGLQLANCPWAQSHYFGAPWTEDRLRSFQPVDLRGFTQLGWLQYTDKATVAGISGGVDADCFYGDLAGLRTLAGITTGEDPLMSFTQQDLETFAYTGAKKALNEGTAAGQLSWAKTEQAILGTVQSLVNIVRAAQSSLAAGIVDVRSSVLGAVAALPVPETDEQAQATAQKILDTLAAGGIEGISTDAILEALRHHPLAPVA